MQVEVIYNQGRLSFAQPVHLKRDHLRLTITVPDDEIVPADEAYQLPAPQAVPSQQALSYAARLDRILAPYRHLLQQSQATESMDHKALWKEHLLEKHLQRHEAPDL